MIKIGQGIDIHEFSDDPNRELRLGGVLFSNARGLKGHSDADVVLHAIADALLGALALGDIGHFFPDTDAQWKNADSRMLLREVMAKIRERGYRVGNLDVTVLAEMPKIAPRHAEIVRSIAECLDCTPEQISVKATTAEKLGFVGRGEGILASAVVLLNKE
jgi:2-C-methyl-D-erythritol 2,4-cyclodiphosphate synthase